MCDFLPWTYSLSLAVKYQPATEEGGSIISPAPYSTSQTGNQEHCFCQPRNTNKKTYQLRKSTVYGGNTAMDLKLPTGAAMFANDKPSRNLCPPALDRDLLLGSRSYIWIKVLLQSANGLWTVRVLKPRGHFSIISQARFQHVALPAELSRRLPVGD